MMSGQMRGTISEELGGVLCYEMEAAGLMNNFPCLVIRDIRLCRFTQAQEVAAICRWGSSYAKDLLMVIPRSAVIISFTMDEAISESGGCISTDLAGQATEVHNSIAFGNDSRMQVGISNAPIDFSAGVQDLDTELGLVKSISIQGTCQGVTSRCAGLSDASAIVLESMPCWPCFDTKLEDTTAGIIADTDPDLFLHGRHCRRHFNRAATPWMSSFPMMRTRDFEAFFRLHQHCVCLRD